MINFFPSDILKEPRLQQKKAISFIDQCIKNNVRYIAIDAPTGCGKSGIAMTVARWAKSTYILTPGVSLQKQYQDDFKEASLAKGRSNYPCTMNDPDTNKKVVKAIQNGKHIQKPLKEKSCSAGKCVGTRNGTRKRILEECSESGRCPYDMMLDKAYESETVVFNYHSFFYQAYLADKFPKRKVMVIDECHDLETFLRDMLSIKFTIYRPVTEKEISKLESIDQWINWLTHAEQFSTILEKDKESYLGRIEKLSSNQSKIYKNFVTNYYIQDNKFKIEFIPIYIGNAAHEFLFKFADIIIFMSGTILNKEMFFKPLGINPHDAAYLRLDTDFPANQRQIVLPNNNSLDLSHKRWNENFNLAVEEIHNILDKHPTEKGIIHVTSYKMAKELADRIRNPRLLTHESENFTFVLQDFIKTQEPKVLISPTCQQGISFDNDMARFQILVRPQFMTPDDKFVKFMLDNNNWKWYYYRASIVFMQSLGRIVRSNTDWGKSYLLDSRFYDFVHRCQSNFPTWLKQSFVKNS